MSDDYSSFLFLSRHFAEMKCSFYCFLQTFSHIVPKWVQKTKIAIKLSKMLVNHLGLTLSKEDLQNVVELMEPYGQISNGIELLNPPLDVRNYLVH